MMTRLTDFILRRTVRRWFETDKDVRETREKLAQFIGRTDRIKRGWSARPVDGAPGLHVMQPRRPLPANAPLVVYFHGGGYIVGGLASHAPFCSRLGSALGARVLFADYRLAPEHPFPAAFEDGLAAWQHAVGMAGGKLLLAGDSAGGGLALAVAQAAMAQGMRAPEGLILFSPWADLTLSGKSLSANAATDAMLSMKILTRMRDLYLAGQEPGDKRDSPLFDANVKLPPVIVVYSESEVLRDDSRRLVKRLTLGGTAVTEVAVAGAPHVFPLFTTVPAGRKVMKRVAAFAV
jgi:acetyl esterase/lipase